MVKKNIKDASFLIVDDNAVNRQVLVYALKKYGGKVDIADNGLKALEMYKNAPYDIVFMDIMMPVMDGLEATVSIREFELQSSAQPSFIVAVSANVQDEDKEHYLTFGFNRITKKPVNLIELDKCVKEKFEF